MRFAVAVRAVCGRCSCGLRLRFVQFAVAVRAIRVCGSSNLRLRFVRFAVAARAVFSPTAENHVVVFRRFPTTTIIIRFLITRFIFQYCDYICIPGAVIMAKNSRHASLLMRDLSKTWRPSITKNSLTHHTKSETEGY